LSDPFRKFRKRALLVAPFLPAVLLLALPFYRPSDVPVLFQFIGRLHPLVLHFPIVLILVVLAVEVGKHFGWIKVRDKFVRVTLIAAGATTIISIIAGFFLYASGEYAGRLMDRHFWGGVITGVLTISTIAFYLTFRKKSFHHPIYVGGLIACTLSVAITSHLGGSLTHGEDFVTEPLLLMGDVPGKNIEKPESEMLVYADMLAPIFEAKCLSCHNAQKSKGGFLMSSYQNLLKPGKSGLTSLVPSLPDSSEIFKRVDLPLDHKEHMPPSGKTPMTPDEVTLLKAWIEAGAPEDLTVSKARDQAQLNTTIENLLPELAKYRKKAAITFIKYRSLKRDLDEVALKLGINIQPDSTGDENYFTIGMRFPPAPFTNAQFRELKPYFDVFSKVSLTSSGLDDNGLYYISQMSNLKELYIQKTKLNGAGLVFLKNLNNLEVLNLSFTKVDDKSLIDLLNVPSLKTVYVYRTNTTKEVIEALGKHKSSLKILVEEGPYF
jgi:uncharacterized membrane protein